MRWAQPAPVRCHRRRDPGRAWARTGTRADSGNEIVVECGQQWVARNVHDHAVEHVVGCLLPCLVGRRNEGGQRVLDGADVVIGAPSAAALATVASTRAQKSNSSSSSARAGRSALNGANDVAWTYSTV